jgi:polyhydroxybutyrate depolymerase
MRRIFGNLGAELVLLLCASYVAACGDSGDGTEGNPITGQGGSAGSVIAPPPMGGVPAPGGAGAAAGVGAGAGAGVGGVPAGGSGGTPAMTAGSGGVAGGEAGTAGAAQAGAGAGGSAGGGTGGAPPDPVTCPATSTLKAGDTTLRTAVGGRSGGMRSYIVHVPASYDGSKPVPLMINFHPLIFGTAMGQRRNSGWAEVGDREGMITAFPDGYDAAWDIGNCCTSGDVDDMAFAKAIVSEISAAACIDPNRVYASGYSMGAGFSHLLGCKASDIFAAIAPSAFDLTEENHTPCQPTRPLTVFSHRGMSDGVVPYAGGATRPPNGTPVTVTMLGAIGTFDEWSRINKCTGEPVVEGACRRRSQCENGVEVVLCNNSGHTEGPADVIWETLKKHGLRGPL